MRFMKSRSVFTTSVFKEIVLKLLKNCVLIFLIFLYPLILFSQTITQQKNNTSEWIYYNSQGKLNYKTLERGDRIIDFSYAGYEGGGVAIPDVPVKITLYPTGGDDIDNIQSAINEVSKMEFSGNFRGAILLAPGNYNIFKTIEISTSGVVLRGSGSGLYGNIKSTINLSGKPFNAITIRELRNTYNEENLKEQMQTQVIDTYIPSGANTFKVSSAEKFSVGDLISIDKPVTVKWVEFMQMNDLVRDGKPQTWLPAGSVLSTDREIVKISGNNITVDVPLTDSYDSDFLEPPGVIVRKINASNRVTNSGIENLHIVSPPQPISHTQRHFTALRINGEDCWARNIFIEETMNSVAVGGKRITVERVTVQRKALHQGSSRPAEFAPNGGQVLVDRCNVIADNVWFVATGGKQSGPIVILNCKFTGDLTAESHQRWSTGMLYDNVSAKNGGIDFRNRGSMGSGHGWSMGWGVAWNCTAKNYTIQNPPGVHNWMIGCTGENLAKPRPFNKEPNLPGGTIDSHGKTVTPFSLYLAQLKERLGEHALKNIGY
jgi:hypothetical protein